MSSWPLLAASLIVRDEAENLPAALASLATLVDSVHVHVYDTGSTDDTVQIARDLGAVVTTGGWADDFAAARNEGLAGWSAQWVLMLDADERVVADGPALRTALEVARADALSVAEDHQVGTATFGQRRVRLFRPQRCHWAGALHENLVARSGELAVADVEPSCLRVEHVGYLSRASRERKALRNIAIAQRTFDSLLAQGSAADPQAMATTLYDLGRTFVAVGRHQDAVDAFETVRELAPGTSLWMHATDLLAQLLLGARMHDVVVVLAEQLRSAGAASAYCDWLSARALPHLGRVGEAWELLQGIEVVVDLSGQVLDPAELAEIRTLVGNMRALVGAGAVDVP